MSLDVYNLQGFRGGIAEDAYKGVKGAFRYGRNLNIRGAEDTLKCNQALKKDSADVVDDLILFFVPATNGNLYGFGDSGNIYRKAGGGASWEKVYTDSDGEITGADEYTNNDGNGNYIPYLYWATETKLKRIPLTGSWSTDVENFANLNGDPSWHTMVMAVGVLMICDGEYIGLVDYEGNFNGKALDIIPGNRTKCILPSDSQAIIGSTRGSKVEEGWLWTWDKIKPSWMMRRRVAEKGVNAMTQAEFLLIQAGIQGSLYYWDSANLVRIRSFPGGGWINPGCVANYGGLPLMGLSGSNQSGLYTYGRLNKNDPYALNLEYVASHGNLNGGFGAVTVYEDKPYASWKNGDEYGVDVLDDENKAEARYEGLVFNAGDPFSTKSYRFIKLLTKPLPVGCWVEVYYRLNETTEWHKATMNDGSKRFDKEGKTKAVFTIETGQDEDEDESGIGETYELAMVLHPSGNETPEVIAASTYFYKTGLF